MVRALGIGLPAACAAKTFQSAPAKQEVQKTLAEETELKPPEVKTEDLLKKELGKASKDDLSRRERRIMREVQHGGRVSVQDVMELNGVGNKTAVSDLNVLIERGLIKRSGRSVSTIYVLND